MNAAGNEHIVHLGLGSNIEPERHMLLAIAALRERLDVRCVSGVWQFPAVGSEGPDFLNAALTVATNLPAEALRTQVLHPLEAELGRQRTADKFAPRSMDIDILVYGDQVLDFEIWTRAHLAIPLAECAPELVEPRSGLNLRQISADLGREVKLKRAAID
ncbi:MAG: 2-amino-4-hydroxy-6-hydroxymethyldihydropteridine diphosphokinase [Anaerolineales bacterium]|nr:2-amino-4-hydroxy-6-hydroxymethyldihydropteridine diphosphokinase [Anaerolineales bacterium]MCW5854806.1 2-amino-4-hydroxy-6-hydroxymethyldihydropteridine diphosphokinase [Anaerolineales bacterium]